MFSLICIICRGFTDYSFRNE